MTINKHQAKETFSKLKMIHNPSPDRTRNMFYNAEEANKTKASPYIGTDESYAKSRFSGKKYTT